LSSAGLDKRPRAPISALYKKQNAHQGSLQSGLPEINTSDFPRIGNYEFLSVLGRGGMGVVCKYRNSTLNKFAAVKMIVSKDLSEAALVRFQREGQAAAKLQHPGIVAVHDLGVTDNGDPYMIMDYYEGETLEQLVKRKYQFSLSQLETIFLQCCEAMQHAHSQGVLHRDLKPSNIMVTNLRSEKLVIKILDFGIAKILDENGEFTTTVGLNAGSPLYMSPEQSQGSPVDARSDIYSLGCVFYATLVGEPPFSGSNPLEIALQRQKDKPQAITDIPHLKSCPSNVSNTIMQMLEKDPWKRPQTMRDACNLLQSKPKAKGGNKNKTITTIAIATILLLCAIAAAVISGYNLHALNTQSDKKSTSDFSLEQISAVMKRHPADDPTASRLFPFVRQGASHISRNEAHITDSDCSALLLDSELRDLSLPQNDITDDGCKTISEIPNLIGLNLESNTRISDAGLKAISASKTIRFLDLRHTQVTDNGMQYLNRMAQLETLHLDETLITDHALPLLTRVTKLSELHIANNAITDNTIETISKMWPNLRRLKVGGAFISARGLDTLKNMPSLEFLSLTHCSNIGEKELRIVCKLKTLHGFESGEHFNDSYTKILCERPDWQELRLDGSLTDRTLQLLMNEKKLVRLKIVGELKASPQAMDKFQRALPHCKVTQKPEDFLVKALTHDTAHRESLTSP
jgi:serine/threonine protein kinase